MLKSNRNWTISSQASKKEEGSTTILYGVGYKQMITEAPNKLIY
jgi:hypothetical protein